MGKARLTLEETKEMLLHVARTMVESKDLLTRADQAIGDGDHGIGMARGFEEVQRKLKAGTFPSVGELLKTAGTALMSATGGASGAVFGTFFRGGAKSLADSYEFDTQQLSSMLADGLESVKERGKARPGDKTMVDALEPAAAAARELSGEPLDSSLPQVAEAARQGMERTAQMVATIGKAKTLGERSLGHVDPGALSTYLIINSMAEYSAR